VFDRQDSGNISYGVMVDGRRWFVKYSENGEMISAMHNAANLNREVRHPCLPSFIDSFTTAKGFALVYEWVNGEVLMTPEFPGETGRNHPASPHYRFRHLPVHRILHALTQVYDLHAYLEERGYVAVDFYDGSIMYDFDQHATYCIDLDHYHKGAFILTSDRLYGSRRFMAPEEFVKGSLIDNRTNVFTMGAAAFVFLADGDRSGNRWRANKALLEVVRKAVETDRNERYPSVRAFYDDWRRALQSF
jgi:serine/threonine-protein kinase